MELEKFPQIPLLQGHWQPVYIEPIFGSGERMTAAIVISLPGKMEIRSVIRPDALRTLYGAKARGLRGIVELAVDSLSQYVLDHRTLDGWVSPMTGIHLGAARLSAGDSVEGILAQAVQLSASLCNLTRLAVKADDDKREAHLVSRNWASQIKDIVATERVDLIPYFDQQGKFFSEGEPVRFGFLGKGLVAHFGVFRPTRLSLSYKDARGRLWELARARKLAEIARTGLILYVPRNDDPSFDQKQLRSAERAYAELELEAKEEHVAVHVVHNTPDGANEVIKLAA